MKYIITDKDELAVGGGYHADLAEGMQGKVVRAGHCLVDEGTKTCTKVWGESIGYGIPSRPEDLEIINRLLPTTI